MVVSHKDDSGKWATAIIPCTKSNSFSLSPLLLSQLKTRLHKHEETEATLKNHVIKRVAIFCYSFKKIHEIIF